MAKVNWYMWKLAIFVAIGTFLYGYDSGIVTITIAKPSWINYMGRPSPNYIGAVASVYSAGQALGCLFQVFVGDHISRIRFLQAMAMLEAAGVIVQAAATSMPMFIAGRAIAGFPTGALYLTTTIYLVEISPSQTRGLVAGCGGLCIGFGIMVSSWIGYGASHLPYGTLQWRLPIALQALWAVILVVGLALHVPELPRFLMFNGRLDEARDVYFKLRPDLSAYRAEKDVSWLRAQVEFERTRQQDQSISELFRLHRKRIGVAFTAGVISSLTGAQVIGYYQIQLYQQLGIELKHRLLLAGVYGTVCFLAVMTTDNFVIDVWGRRNLILFGLIGCVLAQIYSAIMHWQFEFTTNQVGKGFAVGGIYLLTAVHYAAFGSTAGIYQAEVLPVAIRSKMMGLTGFASFCIMTGLSEAAPVAFVTIRQNFYSVFVGATTVCLVIAALWFPETKHKRLEEIAAVFDDTVLTVPESWQKELVRGEARRKRILSCCSGGDVVV
ncbi:Major facilitator-type transporter ecdD [Fulvia fulva]|uniref:Major facilitator-type transporter ecdD n=1 Tax=Passalora fulva TaxID=5499 RepID=A0A9Q8LJL2_PASFU|nr:Major facilitator-type transporter ecdD [Fulvia fulva]KAK4623728.1 Major facilitator-type transporter ecdD [Fulvia fulva]UJO17843.1 Major facilitator-type transporter ecdD [Fulvia fulva]WPV14858.1 Major facilitator-type transporter ecdD [Fulvia fulva]WPV29492.1 Major facilitator-type transporter ecdD [Fulvia fulva]